MSKRKCIVPNCASKEEKTFHVFPAKECIGRFWINAIDNPVLHDLTYAEIKKKKLKVCRKHFPDSAYMGGILKPTLRPNVIPSINVSNPNNTVMEKGIAGYEVRQSSFEELIKFNDNLRAETTSPLQEIHSTPTRRTTKKIKSRKLSIGKSYNVQLTPVAQKFYRISKTVRKQYYVTAFRLRRYNNVLKTFENQIFLLKQTFVTNCHNHADDKLISKLQVVVQQK